ncbi:MAG TPA: prepilin peptidase [Methylocella sp.]|nr:prepilin peptidase [Methylocella sp.]
MVDISPPFDETWCRLAAGVVTGLILGSFVTMLSYRVPRRLSIVWPGSHCPACKTRLKPRDLVPVVSWAVQRGKCRYCGTFIGWRYVLIEIVLALAAAVAFVFFGFTLLLLILLALIVTSVTALVIWLEGQSIGVSKVGR